MGASASMPDAGCGHWEPRTAATSRLRRTLLSNVKSEPCLEEQIRSEGKFEEIVGQSAALWQVLQLVETVATTDSNVLLVGETGTGKELIARAIHDRSSRRKRALVKLNCAAIPSGLLESELFGHERGAFTGAITQKAGRLELADQGTLFLDEVGDIPLELQPKLLRVLQEREFERLGSPRTRRVDARLVAATHRDLERMMAEKHFRSDLYYRLNVFPIEIPPLRERSADIPLLVRHFVQHFAWRMGKTIDTIPSETMDTLTRYTWPGNIPRTAKPDRARGYSLALSSLTGPASRPQYPHQPCSGWRELSNSGTSRTWAHSRRPERDQVGPLRTEGCSDASGNEPLHSQFRMKKLGIVRPWTCEGQL